MDYLYHYTTIETLALILSNRNMRLNSLTKVDDLQEQNAADLKQFGRFFYVSSWTADEKESIAMWKMYSSLDSGVRIKMRKNPFKEYENTPEQMNTIGIPTKDETDGKDYFKSLVTYSECYLKGYQIFPIKQSDLLSKVEYTDDFEKLNPK